MPRPRSSAVAIRAVALAGVVSAFFAAGAAAAPGSPPAPAGVDAGPAPAPGRLFVLLINGGGSREDNFQSHLDHLRELTAHLHTVGVPSERITILAGDGDDPAADLATRREESAEAWLLEGTGLDRHLGEPLRFVTSRLPGATLLPATRKELSRALRETRTRATAADTLLVYVTDHGQQDRRDHLRNRITLWGPNESINVRQLAAELGQLPAGLRVVTVMSQCFSGGFAELPNVIPRGSSWQGPVCGYFASTPDRPAYGCFPESNTGNRSGHAFTLIDALARQHHLPDVHAEVLLRDQTPDVPLRTTDLFLRDVLARAATAAGKSTEALGDELLPAARRARVSELALAESLARVYDGPTPLGLTTLDAELGQLDEVHETVTKHQTLWNSALADQTRAQLDAFLVRQPDWEPRLRAPVVRKLTDEPRRALTRELLTALGTFAASDPALHALLTGLADRASASADLLYRLDVREAAFMRIRILLTSAAARAFLAGAGPAEARARAQLAALDQCEALDLPSSTRKAARVEAPEALASRAADRTSSEGLRPAWLGIAFRSVSDRVRQRLRLEPGAAEVTTVVPQSPAARAGLRVGDLVLGPPGKPFVRPNQVRAFTMMSTVNSPFELEILRRGARQRLNVTLSALPP